MSAGETYLTVQGWVGSKPQFKEVGGRTPQVTFRIGSTPRQFTADRGWSDRPTTWFNVECWRGLAQNTFESVYVGQPVIVTGRLRTHEWTTEAGEQRSKVVLDAISVGHDLSKGTTTFTKSAPRSESTWPDPVRQESPAAALPSTDMAAASATAEPGLGAPFPPDEFTTTTLPLTPTTREAEAA
ncbi:single-stranded DNA-binding protein [Kribbella albertanoniae]|uniref:Single-stranded DNA-binding protein n=1 Tax=Kribbella albertanoniae TaxID=1266829 RepID=A0A4R4P1D5_9ACTN|nr:single-stranded DNA-binding protein [Kribbella albertanoniae]TDC14410.1 single-stranded DNA-binding protein [Kribbella albertanoniae]